MAAITIMASLAPCRHPSLSLLALIPQHSTTLASAHCFPFLCNFCFPRHPWLSLLRPRVSWPRNVCLHLNPLLSRRQCLSFLFPQGSLLQPCPPLPRHQLSLPLFRVICRLGHLGRHSPHRTTPRLLLAGRKGRVYCSVV